jgi:phosphoglycolate phosphatase-like HAD superfamily hydrolase
MGILTRNSRRNALVTLDVCNLLEFFQPECILGRESAAPKPSPAGVEMLLKTWDARPEQAVMCGDFRYDLEAGRNAGTATVYVDIDDEDEWTQQADFRVLNLGELEKLITH